LSRKEGGRPSEKGRKLRKESFGARGDQINGKRRVLEIHGHSGGGEREKFEGGFREG